MVVVAAVVTAVVAAVVAVVMVVGGMVVAVVLDKLVVFVVEPQLTPSKASANIIAAIAL